MKAPQTDRSAEKIFYTHLGKHPFCGDIYKNISGLTLTFYPTLEEHISSRYRMARESLLYLTVEEHSHVHGYLSFFGKALRLCEQTLPGCASLKS